MVVHPAFWQVVSRAALGPEDFRLNWSKLWSMWSLDRSAKNTSMISHRPAIQLFQGAALIGKAVEEGPAKLGPTLSCKLTLLADDRWSSRG